MTITLAIALIVVMVVSTAVLVPQWWAWRAEEARARSLRSLRPLSRSRRKR